MPRKRVSTQDDIKGYRRIARKLGLRLTPMSMKGHPSAEDVFDAVKPKVPSMSFDTVYRTLALLEHHGAISRVQYADDKARYESEMRRHCHLICTRCRRIEDFCWPEIEQLQVPDETARWGKIERRYMELRGVCRDCLAKDARK